ncbi:MAG TPA: MFS transporter [Rhizobiaceae bacterium]|nr:MFS transporter [Rhizobiaceae bacterium]
MTDTSLCATPAQVPASPSINASLVILALAMGGFAIGTTEFAAMSLLPYFAEGLGVNEPAAAHAISAYALGVVIGSPIIALLGARWPRRNMLIGLMALFGIGNVLSALAPSYGWLLLFRFMSGVPHGAYFGVAALLAASLVARERRASAVASVMLGLTVAMIGGVALATWLGQTVGWRWGFALPGLLALITMGMIASFAPADAGNPLASPLRELAGLRNRQVWLTLATGVVGFGGFFAVYSFTASTLLSVTQVSPWLVGIIIPIFGIGATFGTIAAGRAANRALMATPAIFMLGSAAVMVIFPFAAGNAFAIGLVILAVGFFGGFPAVLQTRLMDVSPGAQTLVASLHHSAFNAANALGPGLAGMAVTMGYGFPAAGFVGSVLALCGVALWLFTWRDAKLSARG